jgi:hypothetical protein
MIRSEKGVSILVGLAVVIVTALVALPSRSASTGPAMNPGPRLRSKAESESAPIDPIALQREYAATLRWGRNPFRSPEVDQEVIPDQAEVVDPEAPKLSGISTIDDCKMAIVDSQIVRQGDVLKTGHEVIEVTDNSVTLLCDGRQITLILGVKP